MMVSANDVAVMLAEAAGGSVARFSRAMDAESELLGLRPPGGTRTASMPLATARPPSTWPSWPGPCSRTAGWPGSRNARRPSRPRAAAGTRHRPLPVPARVPGRRRGQDRLHRRRRALPAAAPTRGGRTLIAVVLHSPDNAADAGKLLDWGFGRGRSARNACGSALRPGGQRGRAPHPPAPDGRAPPSHRPRGAGGRTGQVQATPAAPPEGREPHGRDRQRVATGAGAVATLLAALVLAVRRLRQRT